MKLLAKTIHEKHFLSSLVQNSITRFSLIKLQDFNLNLQINRFCWENSIKNNENHRIYSNILIRNVKKMFISETELIPTFLELLLIACSNKNTIKLIFANDFVIKLHGENLEIILKDISDFWLSDYAPSNHFNDLI